MGVMVGILWFDWLCSTYRSADDSSLETEILLPLGLGWLLPYPDTPSAALLAFFTGAILGIVLMIFRVITMDFFTWNIDPVQYFSTLTPSWTFTHDSIRLYYTLYLLHNQIVPYLLTSLTTQKHHFTATTDHANL